MGKLVKQGTAAALALALILGLAACGGAPQQTTEPPAPETGGQEQLPAAELEYKGQTGQGSDKFMGDPQDVYWFNASVQHPEDYTRIVGFRLTAKMTKIDYYGGGKETKTMACGIILVSEGAQDPDDYIFTYEDGQFPKYDLSGKDIVAFGVGDAGFLATMAFSNGRMSDAGMQEGDTVTLTYEGETALFREGEPTMTVLSFLSTFEYESIEWILGDPIQTEEQEWQRVETLDYPDIPTVAGDRQNGFNYVDITVPAEGEGPFPVILWIHGGGYVTGDRKNCILSNTRDYLLAQGYAFVSAEYTLTQMDGESYGQGGMPQMLYDLKAAVRFLRANGDAYRLDTDYIAAMGESAGAGLALLLGTTNGSEEHEDLTMGNEGFSSDIQAMVSFCGPTDFTGQHIYNMAAYIGRDMADYENSREEIDALAKLWSPVVQLDDTAAPMFLSYSMEDTTVPPVHAETLADMAAFFMDQEDVKVVRYETGGHVDRNTFDSYGAYVTLAAWLQAQRAG